ncbi:MAG: ATP-dependent DNA helicase RecG [Candidatus Hydrogenedentota bacterium]
MSIQIHDLEISQAMAILKSEEGQFCDVKALDISPAKLTKTISAFANSDGGDVYIGIDENGFPKVRAWRGFLDPEKANGHLQIFEELFPLGSDFQYEFLRTEAWPGLVLHVQVNKTRSIVRASNSFPYIRRGAQSIPIQSPDEFRRLEYAKGISSFEDENTQSEIEVITESEVTKRFIEHVIPSAEAAVWLKKQALIRQGKPTVAGVLVFSDEPQAQLPKRCGIKLYRYRTSEAEGFREVLEFTPETIEGCLYDQIKQTVQQTIDRIESIQKMGEKGLEPIKYPPETLHEIITNAVLHRDYSVADDVHIRIFDNRVEVQSPGSLPAHVTIDNILNERFARNGAIVRILNKFPDPPNKDIGEGLNTAFSAMHSLGLREPVIKQKENSVLVIIRHEQLATPEETIMDYLGKNDTINNKKAREITHIRADYQVKNIFGRMVATGMIEQVPGTRTGSTKYRKKTHPGFEQMDLLNG